jgi:hypothetical protein
MLATFAKLANSFGKLVAVLFTSVVAPILVNVVVKDLNGEEVTPRAETAAVENVVVRPAPLPAVTEPAPASLQVIVEGVGKNPDDAFRDALRTALSRASAAQVDAARWTRFGPALVEDVVRDRDRLVVAWRELSATKEWRLRGTLHHREIAVELNREALAERLQAALRRDPGVSQAR